LMKDGTRARHEGIVFGQIVGRSTGQQGEFHANGSRRKPFVVPIPIYGRIPREYLDIAAERGTLFDRISLRREFGSLPSPPAS
jgi:hypothetical protein